MEPGDYTREVTVDGVKRSYLLHVPEGLNQSQPVPVILGFHGGGSTSEQFARITGLSDRAGGAGFVLVYPDGWKRAWNAGDCCGEAKEQGIDDVGFVRAILDDLASVVNVDSRRVFAAGISNGGKMTYRLACELADRIVAVAVVGSTLGVADCHPARPVPLLHIHGTADRFVPLEGGASVYKPMDKQRPVLDTIRFWSGRNGCATEPRVTLKNAGVTCFTYSNCSEGGEVVLFIIEGMGHQWPGRTVRPEVFGPGTEALLATDALVAFFAQHAMPSTP